MFQYVGPHAVPGRVKQDRGLSLLCQRNLRDRILRYAHLHADRADVAVGFAAVGTGRKGQAAAAGGREAVRRIQSRLHSFSGSFTRIAGAADSLDLGAPGFYHLLLQHRQGRPADVFRLSRPLQPAGRDLAVHNGDRRGDLSVVALRRSRIVFAFPGFFCCFRFRNCLRDGCRRPGLRCLPCRRRLAGRRSQEHRRRQQPGSDPFFHKSFPPSLSVF